MKKPQWLSVTALGLICIGVGFYYGGRAVSSHNGCILQNVSDSAMGLKCALGLIGSTILSIGGLACLGLSSVECCVRISSNNCVWVSSSSRRSHDSMQGKKTGNYLQL